MIVIVLSLMYSLRIHGTHIHVVGSWQGSQQERPSWYYFRLQWTRGCVSGSVSATRILPGVPVLPAFVPRSVRSRTDFGSRDRGIAAVTTRRQL